MKRCETVYLQTNCLKFDIINISSIFIVPSPLGQQTKYFGLLKALSTKAVCSQLFGNPWRKSALDAEFMDWPSHVYPRKSSFQLIHSLLDDVDLEKNSDYLTWTSEQWPEHNKRTEWIRLRQEASSCPADAITLLLKEGTEEMCNNVLR
jgi:hypothetical protein